MGELESKGKGEPPQSAGIRQKSNRLLPYAIDLLRGLLDKTVHRGCHAGREKYFKKESKRMPKKRFIQPSANIPRPINQMAPCKYQREL